MEVLPTQGRGDFDFSFGSNINQVLHVNRQNNFNNTEEALRWRTTILIFT